VDTTKEVNDSGTRRGLSRLLIASEEHVGKKDTHAGTGVGFEHKEYRTTGLCRLGQGDGLKDAMVDGIVQEEDFGWFDNDGKQWQKTGIRDRWAPALSTASIAAINGPMAR
jgi:hypothetical protein